MNLYPFQYGSFIISPYLLSHSYLLSSIKEDIISFRKKLEEEFVRTDVCLTKDEYELKNMLITAKLIVLSALRRKESRGAHYRIDYLNTNEICEHSMLNKVKGELNFVK